MTLQQFKKKLTSKKFFAFLLVLFNSSVLVWFDKIDSGSFQVIIMMITPLYFASDVSADWVKNEEKKQTDDK